jgi:hypothetical protein
VGGTLDVGGNFGGLLHLTGALPRDRSNRGERRFDFPVVLGESVDSDRITLLRGAVTSERGPLGGSPQSQELVAANVLVGEHLQTPSPVFDHAYFELSLLAEWVGAGGNVGVSESTGDNDDFVIAYHRTPPRKAAVEGVGEVALVRDFEYSANIERHLLRTFHRFEVSFRTPVSIDELFDNAIAPLQNLLTFAMFAPSKSRRIFVTCPGLLITPDREWQTPLAVHRSTVDGPSIVGPQARGWYEALFLLERSPVPFEQLVPKWFELSRSWGPLIDLFLVLDYAPPAHIETQFINVCQAVEGYHRAVFTTTVMEPTEHRKLVKALLDSAPENRRDWLRGVLANSNEPSFKRRIDELVERAGSVVRPLIGTRPKYAARMRDNRNNFAHWLAKEPPAYDVATELDDLIRVTRYVLAACLLQDLGWSEAQVEETLRPNWRFAQAVGRG